MTLSDLRIQTLNLIQEIKDNGNFPKENNVIDYKLKMNINSSVDETENFLVNFGKDIISFSNSDGGIILIGIEENSTSGVYVDSGLDINNQQLLLKVDLVKITQKFEKITKVGVSVDLQPFKVGTREFYYLLIQKQNQILVPSNDYPQYKLKKGEIIYRASSKNELANESTNDFNRFLQIKASEKNKEFMEIWSKLLPEIFDINPREILMINPKTNRVYGFNGKDNVLASSNIEIDRSEAGVFNVILQAISAGEIGKISDVEGKPLFKIVGEIKSSAPRQFIYMTDLDKGIKQNAKYNYSTNQLKEIMKYLGWVNDENFKVQNPDGSPINNDFSNFIWIETLSKEKRVAFSQEAIEPLTHVINNSEIHEEIFGKKLHIKIAK